VVKARGEVINRSKQKSYILKNENYKGKNTRITGGASHCGEGMCRGI
jgi:hypothetical protein